MDAPINGPCSWTVPGDIPKGAYLVYFWLKDPNFTYSTPYNIILPRDLVKVKK